MSQLPTLLFIPGAWHKPSCYNKITSILEKKDGFKCLSITLPTTTGDPSKGFKDDFDAAQDALSGELSLGNDVVIIAHSYGGMIANSCVKGFTRVRHGIEKASISRDVTSKGYVIGIVLIASGFTFTGLTFMDPFFRRPPPAWRVNKETGYADIVGDPGELFYHDLPREEAEHWASQLTPQSLKALFEGGEFSYAGWQDVPVWYLGTVEDRGLPVLVQRMAIGMAQVAGRGVVHRELQTSHSPFLSKPEETAEFVFEAVHAFAGSSVDKSPNKRVLSPAIVPVPRLQNPSTWFRYGLPLLFGRFLGVCYLGLYGLRRLWA